MTTTTELWYMPATELANAIRSRQVSPVEVVDVFLDRIEAVNPKINAFTIVLGDEARAAARDAEEALSRGAELGPLHGVPFTIKDLTVTKGVRTMGGSRAFKDRIPTEDAPAVERLLGAGGIFIGKTTTPELGNKGITESPVTGTTNNPWKTTHMAGGSSGGAAAAVAAGMCALAEGTDGGGSVRIPASCCGVVGHKPSFGRVPIYRPPSSGFATLSHEGPIARTVADTALMLNTLAGPDDRDPYSLPSEGVDYLAAIEGASVRGLRMAYSRNLGLGPVDPQVVARTDAAARAFAEELGAHVEEATPDLPNPEEAMITTWSTVEGASVVDDLLPRVARDDIDPALLALADRMQTLSALDYHRAAVVFRGLYYQGMRRFFESYDLLLTPTLTTPPFPHPGWHPGPETVAGQKINRTIGWLLTYPFNLTGQPAISVPCGFSDDGLPIGLQIVGRRLADVAVLRAAAAYEAVAPWADRHPPV